MTMRSEVWTHCIEMDSSCVLLGAGYFRLASLVQYVPLPVVGSFLAYVGYFCLTSGITVATGVQVCWHHLHICNNFPVETVQNRMHQARAASSRAVYILLHCRPYRTACLRIPPETWLHDSWYRQELSCCSNHMRPFTVYIPSPNGQ